MQNLEGIKNIIFDLGDVLIPLRKSQASKAFRQIMPDGQESPDVFSFKTLDAFTDYETGKITSADFIDSLKPYFKHDVSDDKIIEAWNKIIGDFPVAHVEMLTMLSPHYRLFVLSNTNEIHVAKYEKEVPGVSHLSNLFEKLYYSHLMGLRKPQPEIYKRVINENNLIPSETLFADDLQENLLSAGQLGIRTLYVTPQLNLCNWFNEHNQI
jgi:epoxide hydrolase-like predicted phosphatase